MKTWLYIKQHNKTGLKYFGKTVKDPILYNGSGNRWMNHLKVHGRDITTVWCRLFSNTDKLVEYALNFSEKNNIVESEEWANLQPENGIDGNVAGNKCSSETKNKISRNTINTHKGQIPWNKGKAMSATYKAKIVKGLEKYRIANPDWYEKSFGNPAIREKREAKRLAVICKPVCVDGIIYPSATATAKALGLKKTTLIKRVLSKNFESYRYISTT